MSHVQGPLVEDVHSGLDGQRERSEVVAFRNGDNEQTTMLRERVVCDTRFDEDELRGNMALAVGGDQCPVSVPWVSRAP